MEKTENKDLATKPQTELEEYEIPAQLEGMSKIAAATTVAQTLSYSTERKFLDTVPNENCLCYLKLNGSINHSLSGFKWLKITQVGKFSSDSRQNCFDAMQTILHSCHIPNTQLAFLIIGEKGVYKMFFGIKGIGKMNGVKNFILSNWKGVVCKKCDEADTDLHRYVNNEAYNKCYAFTGVPTINAQNRYSRGIDQIVSGFREHEEAAYLVIANPVSPTRIDGVLNTCRELQSQSESFKSFSLSENLQKGKNRSLSKSTSHTITKTITEQVENGDGKKAMGVVLGVTGLAVATALIYPPAIALLPAIVNKAASAIESVPRIKSALTALQAGSSLQKQFVASGLIPKQTPKKVDNSEADVTSSSESYGYSESYSQSISQTITNSHIEAVVEHLKKHASRMEEGKATGMWEVGCYLFTSIDDNASCAMQVKSVLSGMESIYEPIRIHDISTMVEESGSIHGFVERPLITSNYSSDVQDGYEDTLFRHPFGDEFSHVTSILTTKELSCFVNFPMNSLPGISVVDQWPDFSLTPQSISDNSSALRLGHLLFNGSKSEVPVSVPLDTFSRHALVAGVNGSGKTNSVLSVMNGFLQKGSPIMIIEPAKTEYVDWAIKYNKGVEEFNSAHPNQPMKKIKIFIPGCDHYAKGDVFPELLKLNPFEVIRINDKYEYRVLSHIDKLKSVLASAFPMQEILPTVIERLLYKLYTDLGWIKQKERQAYPDKFPTLNDINLKSIKELMTDLGYAEENTQNISAAIRTRFNSMKYGWKNTLLNNERIDGMTWEDFFGNPCVINLSYAGDDADKSFIISLLMQFLYEYRVAESEKEGYSYDENKCDHLVVIEEAHRVMTRCENPDMPQYRSNQMFSSILSEVRAYSQGVMVVDQVPSRLIEDAVKNTNIKIVHKVVAADDAKILAESMGLTQEQQDVIPKLSIGQAILSGLNSAEVESANASDIYLAKIDKNK